MSEYHVTVLWDDEAKVWIGTSEDVPGLCVEARTLEEVMQEAERLIPDLLMLNGVLPQGDTRPIPFHYTPSYPSDSGRRVAIPCGKVRVATKFGIAQ